MHICHLAFSGSTALAYRSCDQHTKLRGSQRLVQTGSTSNATHQVIIHEAFSISEVLGNEPPTHPLSLRPVNAGIQQAFES